ncbi:MAG: tetratricopeptide repeat protein [Bacteroidota bacterium]
MTRDRHIIQKYLDHELSEKEMDRFEQDLGSSPDLQADLFLFQEVDEAVSDTEVLDFRAQLKDLRKDAHNEELNHKRVIRFNRPWQYAASAAVALILAIGLATILDRPLSSKDLFRKYYKPYEVALINRSSNGDLDLVLRRALQYYQEENYGEAVSYFEEVLKSGNGTPATDLYTGISYMEIEKYLEAGKSFNKVIAQNDNLYMEQAEWYLGFCFLATNETDRARRQFARIASSNSYYREDAEKILKKLRK